MTRRWVCALVLLLLSVPAAAQRPGAGRAMERRLQLEEQVLTRFVQQAGDEMGLDAPRREQLRDYVRTAAAERRELHLASMELRRRLLQSVNQNADDAQFERLLGELRDLQNREQALADREQQRLARFLTPRQRAQYLLLWLRLQENARGILMQRRGAPGPAF